MAAVIITLVYIITIWLQCQQRGAGLGDKWTTIKKEKGTKQREKQNSWRDIKNKADEARNLSHQSDLTTSFIHLEPCSRTICMILLVDQQHTDVTTSQMQRLSFKCSSLSHTQWKKCDIKIGLCLFNLFLWHLEFYSFFPTDRKENSNDHGWYWAVARRKA